MLNNKNCVNKVFKSNDPIVLIDLIVHGHSERKLSAAKCFYIDRFH